ncbi:PLP-dependent aminotransferase family protein [Methanocalculus taiwanensis]|uniref:PLP-dependent aminotransferase family protein n=1 Tax=Methanocalculus taiwanensis TaxID=106207 RepID=A0ABD4THW2_9EURY|nr:PLP-dependent aminotransferase family protein [Methanocalculus taiwanensis]MCQ1537887.1 PLP-dependent aminotransferase family protein [Methanocalculus taiwanensis]
MQFSFSSRYRITPTSFLDELFRVSRDPSIISFAGGLPDTDLIDLDGIRDATAAVLEEEGRAALQYTTTDGYLPLRECIARRYQERLGIPAVPEEIQIVNGSQQCLDIMGKIFISRGSHIGMEAPGYLGAIDAFSLYEPIIHTVPIIEGGPDPDRFEKLIHNHPLSFFYGIPNCQNPSGTTYSDERRRHLAEILTGSGCAFFEDDAFGELFFDGKPRLPMKHYLLDQTILSGSFSKIIAPGLRIGWIYAPVPVLERFNHAKQAADLHSNLLSQMILVRYLQSNSLDLHIKRITAVYKEKCRLICDHLDALGLTHTEPEGGMFLMATLPEGTSSMQLFKEGVKAGVAILPGIPFYPHGGGEDTIRINFSSPSTEEINLGMERLKKAFRAL